MARWLKPMIWVVAVVAIVWLAVIISWQSTTHIPSQADLLGYMVVLPVAIVGAGWGVYSLIKTPPAKPVTPGASPQDNAADLAAQAAEKSTAVERGWTMDIVATSLHTSQGASSAEVLEKLMEDAIRPALDDALKTPDGFPVFSARIAGLDATPVQELLQQWTARAGVAALDWDDLQHRVLHLASLAVAELVAVVIEHPQVQHYLANVAQGRRNNDDAVVPLRLIFLWPSRWSAQHQASASAWAKWLVMRSGWPEHRLVLHAAHPDQNDPIALLDFVTLSAHRAKLPTLGMMVACDSGIDQDYVDHLHASKKLFGGENPLGLKPGELAAGILFADSQQSELFEVEGRSRLHRASRASRDKSADEKGRLTSELLGSLADLALEAAQVAASDLTKLSADHDQRPSRVAELGDVLSGKFPELDLFKDVLTVGQACGSMQHMSTAGALCLAHQYVVEEQAAVLCLSLFDPLMRCAVVLSVPAANHAEGESGDLIVA